MNSNIFTDLDPDVYKAMVFIFILILVMRFILSIVKSLLDYKLKNRIIEKGLTEEFTASLLQPDKIDKSAYNIKWFLLFLSTGIGLILTQFFPVGIISIAVIAICISFGLLANYFYIKNFVE